jgi:hypothetical protein
MLLQGYGNMGSHFEIKEKYINFKPISLNGHLRAPQ